MAHAPGPRPSVDRVRAWYYLLRSRQGLASVGSSRRWWHAGRRAVGWRAPVRVLDREVEVEGLQQDALAHEDLLLERPELPRLRVGCGRRVVLRLVPARESGRTSSVWGALSRAGLWLRRGWGHSGHFARYHSGYLYAWGAGPQSGAAFGGRACGFEGTGATDHDAGERPGPWLWQGWRCGAAVGEGGRRVNRLEGASR